MECGERETDGALASAHEFVGLPHFSLHVMGDGLVKRGLDVGELVIDGVGAALGEKRGAVELDQLLFDHAAHEVGRVDLVRAIFVTVAPVEAVGVEEREEELKVLVFAVVRRGRHQKQVSGMLADLLGEAEAPGLFEFRAEVVGGEFVRLVEDDEIPAGGAELGL